MKMLYLQCGGPTAELFEASYNNRSNKSNELIVGAGENGYTENASYGWFQEEDNYGIYGKTMSNKIYFLASPYGFKNSIMIAGSSGRFGGWNIESDSYNIRPIVCIPTLVFNSKYTLVEE